MRRYRMVSHNSAATTPTWHVLLLLLSLLYIHLRVLVAVIFLHLIYSTSSRRKSLGRCPLAATRSLLLSLSAQVTRTTSFLGTSLLLNPSRCWSMPFSMIIPKFIVCMYSFCFLLTFEIFLVSVTSYTLLVLSVG